MSVPNEDRRLGHRGRELKLDGQRKGARSHVMLLRTVGRIAIVCAGIVLAGRTTAQDEVSRDLLAPTGLRVVQVGYEDGAASSNRFILTWQNVEEYLVVDVLVDGEVVGAVDGAEMSAKVSGIGGGERTFGVRGVVFDNVSEVTSLSFQVENSSPVSDPVSDFVCQVIEERGGTLRVVWSLGATPWESAEVRVGCCDVVAEVSGDQTELEIEAVGHDVESVTVVFRNAAGYESEGVELSCGLIFESFRRGDCDNDGTVTISDAIFELNHLFLGGRRWYCDDACDVDDDGSLVVTDPILVLQWLFLGGSPPMAPGPGSCGVDLTPDHLGGICVCPGA